MAPRILVVDDEPDLEILVTQKFRRQIKSGELGFLFARDGQEALALLEDARDIDIVLSDINMPRMDGLTLLRRLRELQGERKTVIVSAYGDMKNIRTAMNLGAFDFITKPIEFVDLEVTIKKTIEDLEKLREAYRQRRIAEQARANLARYFSPNLAERLAEDSNGIELSGVRRELTIMFTDLANFTPLVESLEPSVLASVMSAYFDGLTRIVFEHGGTVCKIVGDALHAVFGAPEEQPDHAARGIACALELDAFAEDFRHHKRAEGLSFGMTRIGVHAGPAVVGNFGGKVFFDYSVYGTSTNIASRLQSANKQLGTRICVSGAVAESTGEFKGRPVGRLTLKGIAAGLKAFEPLRADQAGSAAVQAYCAAYERLESGDYAAARQVFAALVGQYSEDPLATFHLRRLLAGETGIDILITEK